MMREEAEQYLYYAMTIGETASLLRSRGWTCGRYHTADLPGIWSHPGRCFFYHIQYCDDYLWRGFRYLHPDAACAGNVQLIWDGG